MGWDDGDAAAASGGMVGHASSNDNSNNRKRRRSRGKFRYIRVPPKAKEKRERERERELPASSPLSSFHPIATASLRTLFILLAHSLSSSRSPKKKKQYIYINYKAKKMERRKLTRVDGSVQAPAPKCCTGKETASSAAKEENRRIGAES